MNVRWITPDDGQRHRSFQSASDNTERNLLPTPCTTEFASRVLQVLSVLHRLSVVQMKTEPREFGMKLWLIVRGKRDFECRPFPIKSVELTNRKIKFNNYHTYIRMKKLWRNFDEKEDKKNRGKQENNIESKSMTARRN